MKIQNLTLDKTNARIRASATLLWEENVRPDFEMFFETGARAEDAFDLNPHVFLLAALYPAMRLGEKRIRIEGAVCPDLKDGLNTATGLVSRWYGKSEKPFPIESTEAFRARPTEKQKESAQMISCGIDSLFTLWKNLKDYPPGHPGRVRAGLFMYGFDMGNTPETYASQMSVYERVRSILEEIGGETGIDILVLYTNARHLLVDRWMFKYQAHSATLAAVAHCFSGRFHRALIPSSAASFNLQRWGSHPLLDPHYSSAELRILYDGFEVSRLGKVRSLVSWETAMNHLRVCYLNPETAGNCGVCPKCFQAMAALAVAGGLERVKTFPEKDLPVSVARAIRPGALLDHGGHFPELIAPLKEMGRGDLAGILSRKLFLYHLLYGRDGLTGLIPRLDKTAAGRLLRKGYEAIRA